MKVSRIFQKIAETKPCQKFFKWCASPGKDAFLNKGLPSFETIFATSAYVWSTARQKNIEKEQRDLLQIQNVGSGLVGLCLSSLANQWVYKQGEAIIKDLDTKKIDPKSIRQISTGIRVILPIATTALLLRGIIPTLLAGFSGRIMDKVREKNSSKIDIKA